MILVSVNLLDTFSTFVFEYKWRFLLYTICSVVSTILLSRIDKIFEIVIDVIKQHLTQSELNNIFTKKYLFLILGILSIVCQKSVLANFSAHMTNELTLKIIRTIQKLPQTFINQLNPYDMSNNVSYTSIASMGIFASFCQLISTTVLFLYSLDIIGSFVQNIHLLIIIVLLIVLYIFCVLKSHQVIHTGSLTSSISEASWDSFTNTKINRFYNYNYNKIFSYYVNTKDKLLFIGYNQLFVWDLIGYSIAIILLFCFAIFATKKIIQKHRRFTSSEEIKLEDFSKLATLLLLLIKLMTALTSIGDIYKNIQMININSSYFAGEKTKSYFPSLSQCSSILVSNFQLNQYVINNLIINQGNRICICGDRTTCSAFMDILSKNNSYNGSFLLNTFSGTVEMSLVNAVNYLFAGTIFTNGIYENLIIANVTPLEASQNLQQIMQLIPSNLSSLINNNGQYNDILQLSPLDLVIFCILRDWTKKDKAIFAAYDPMLNLTPNQSKQLIDVMHYLVGQKILFVYDSQMQYAPYANIVIFFGDQSVLTGSHNVLMNNTEYANYFQQ